MALVIVGILGPAVLQWWLAFAPSGPASILPMPTGSGDNSQYMECAPDRVDRVRRVALRAGRGSHHVFQHAARPGHISVPHPKKDLGVGLVHKLLKQAGLK
jgi:hypothetical protein